ncbi:autophagy-related protein 2 homolog A-like [Sinocyclocheilus grahami]|uniref:autophagy-related protein 2 homolog A-like n=1 Tax=Sinocyclocheilus grahami TaxID=75366 RepID=UPI0007ACC804|nr:PREDICTED: autophagy-related protein 2 homolog A-like [Sinocyclocheilus grahami]
MSRWLFPWSGSIKKRACRYLLQHYLGHFLEERLSLDQLSLDLYNGSGVIREINLDVWAVNELLESLGAPLEIVEGFVNSITVTIPWAALVTEHCTLEITGLQITCRPKYRTNGNWDSQGWSSCMTSSMQLAQECLKDPPEASEEPPAPLEGLEMFAQTIETVLRRIKVTFLDTIVRVEHHSLDAETGVALEMRIKRVDYCDEAVRDSSQTVPVDIHQPPAFLHKILQLNSVQLLYETLGGSQGLVYSDDMASSRETDKTDENDDDDASDAPQSLHPTPKPPEPLLIGQCSGFIETTVKIKQNEMLPGPKLELDGKVGCLHLLLSPSQITHLTDLLSSLCIETSEGSGGVGVSGGGVSRPLGSDDLRLIEEDLSKQLNSEMYDRDMELDAEPYVNSMENREMFYSMGPGMTSSVLSTRSGSELSDSDMESSIHSQSSLAQTNPLSPQGMLNCPRRYPVPGSLSSLPQCSRPPKRSSRSSQSEPLKPDSLLRLSLGGVTLTLLEQDPPPGPDGLSSLAEVSQLFFHELAFFKDGMFSERDFHNLRGSFAKACPHSHIRMTGAAVQLTCEMRGAGRHTRATTSDLSFSRLELLECLWESGGPQYTELLQFQSAGLFTMGTTARPCAQFHHSLSEKHMRKRGSRRRVIRRDSSLRIELGELNSELDLDIISRLEDILQALRHCPAPPQRNTAQAAESHLLELHSSLLLQSPYAVVKVRFPIPDLRPPGLRRPLSQRAVRSEILSLQISNLELKSQQGPDIQQDGPCSPGAKLTKLLEACFTDMHGVYEGWEGEAFPCIRVQKSADPDGIPRIQVRVNEGAGSDCTGVCEGVNRDLGLGSMSLENPCELREKNSSPFSSNRTMFETEEMVIPADPEEMDEFQTQCICQCQYVVDITFPVAYILLPSKEAFLSIYNRINNDLLMWESPPPPPSPPPAPPPSFQSSRSPSHQHRPEENEFYLCKSAFRLESDSEEEEPQFFSAKQSKRRKPLEPQSSHALSLLCLTVLIGKGRLQAMTDCKNEAGRKMDFCHGELVLDLEGGKIFSVSQHQNNPNLNFLTIESRRVELYHKAEVPDSPIPVKLEMPRFTSPGHLDPTIYPTEVGVSSVGGRETDVQMLSTAIKITLDLERNVKEFLVALRLHGATLRHHMALTNHSWHEQIVDFLDVIDDDILGYTPPAVITVLHTHLATCAVDYRPLYLPLRVLFTAESFSLSSNIFVVHKEGPDIGIGGFKTQSHSIINRPVSLIDELLSESPASLPPCPPAETAEINQCDLTDALIDTERILQEETQDSGSPSIRRASPVSVYLFPGEAPKLRPSVLEEEESDIDGLVSTAMEAHADMMSEEGSEGSTDNDDFCILEAPGMGIPPRDGEPVSSDLLLPVRTDVPQKASDDTDPGSGLGHDLSASVETTYSEQSSSSAGSSSSSDQPIYFREFRFTSEVPIWLDYHGKHVVIEQGTFAGILIGLAQLNCSELKLKRLCCRHGLLGVDKVIQYAVNEWLTDIRKNQLPGILGGVGPMHSVVQLIHGVRDLFWMPIEQYRKDGRIIRGLQRGAASFGTSTASAALELSNRLVQAIQATAETVYDILSPTPPLTRYITDGRPTPRPRRTPQPADLREGVAKAYDTVREGVIDTAQTLCDVASRGHEQKGLPGAVGGVLRQIPPTVVRPLIVASEATSNLLGGMRNQIKPDARKEDFLKWRTEDGQE